MNAESRHFDDRCPGGMTVIELLAALAVITAAMVALVQILGVAKRQAHARDERMAALSEVANEAERLALAKWDDVAPDKLTAWQPSPELLAAIAQPACVATVVNETDPPSRRIELTVSWKNAAGQAALPVTLTLWRYPSEGQP